MKFPRHQLQAAFTLIELIISTALMALILVSAYLCLNAGLAAKKLIEPRADAIQSARVALALMSQELRCACELPGDSPLLGLPRTLGNAEADNLDFATHYFTPNAPDQGDFCEVSYYVQPNPDTGHLSLWRRQNPCLAPNPLAGGIKREIIPDILGLQLEYTDGLDWYTTWGDVQGAAKAASSLKDHPNLDGLPLAVRITLLMDPNPNSHTGADTATRTGEPQSEPPLVFQTVAYLNLAATTLNNNDTGPAGGDGSNSDNGGDRGSTPGGSQ